MTARIDFDMYVKPAEEQISPGLLAEGVKQLMPRSKALAEVMKLLEKDSLVYWVSCGNWSMHEMLTAILSVTGAADVMISSYAMSETPARILSNLKTAGAIEKLSILIDSRVDVRTVNTMQIMKSIADELKLIKTHAKVTIVTNCEHSITVIGSANYTENNRYECGIITNSIAAAEMQTAWMKKALKHGN